MTPRDEAQKALKTAGYRLKRQGANHEIYFNPVLNKTIPLKRHAFSKSDLRYIQKEIKQNQP